MGEAAADPRGALAGLEGGAGEGAADDGGDGLAVADAGEKEKGDAIEAAAEDGVSDAMDGEAGGKAADAGQGDANRGLRRGDGVFAAAGCGRELADSDEDVLDRVADFKQMEVRLEAEDGVGKESVEAFGAERWECGGAAGLNGGPLEAGDVGGEILAGCGELRVAGEPCREVGTEVVGAEGGGRVLMQKGEDEGVEAFWAEDRLECGIGFGDGGELAEREVLGVGAEPLERWPGVGGEGVGGGLRGGGRTGVSGGRRLRFAGADGRGSCAGFLAFWSR